MPLKPLVADEVSIEPVLIKAMLPEMAQRVTYVLVLNLTVFIKVETHVEISLGHLIEKLPL